MLGMWRWNKQWIIISGSLPQRALHMVLQSSRKLLSPNTSVITSIIQRQIAVSASTMMLLVSIGKFQQSMQIFQRKIRSMRC